VVDCVEHELDSVRNAELFENPEQVFFDCMLAQPELGRDVTIAQPVLARPRPRWQREGSLISQQRSHTPALEQLSLTPDGLGTHSRRLCSTANAGMALEL